MRINSSILLSLKLLKKFVALFILLNSFHFYSSAQNIFSNPDFEIYSTCPITQGQVDRATGWYTMVVSSDYMNCAYTGWASQLVKGAYSGTGYMGFASYQLNGSAEAIGQTLPTPLIASQTYTLSFYAKMTTGGSGYGTVCGGVCFFGFNSSPAGNYSTIYTANVAGANLLGCTGTISNTSWQPYTIILQRHLISQILLLQILSTLIVGSIFLLMIYTWVSLHLII